MAKVIKPVILDETAQISNVRLAEIRDALLGTSGGNYNTLSNKPQINGVALQGNQTGTALGLQNTLVAGTNITMSTSLATGLTTISATAGEPAQYLKNVVVTPNPDNTKTVKIFDKNNSYVQFTTGGGSGSSYAEGTGIIIDTTVSPNTISVDTTTIAETAYVDGAVGAKADKTYVDTQDTALQTNIDKKQDLLVDTGADQNIKTVDGVSLLGTGNLTAATLTTPISVTNAVGNVTVGTTFPVGTRLEAIIKEMLTMNSATAYLTFTASPAGSGHFDRMSGSYAKGTPVVVTATGDGNYTFDKWSDGDTSNPRTIIPTNDAEYVAEFVASTVTVTIAVDDPSHGNVTGATSGQYAPGTLLTLTAVPASGYAFDKWLEDGQTIATKTVAVPNMNTTYTATFKSAASVPATFAKGAVFYRAVWDETAAGGGDFVFGNFASATSTTNKEDVTAEFATATKENCFWYNPSAKVTYTDAEKAALLADENGITVGVNEGNPGENNGWFTVFLSNFGQDPGAIKLGSTWETFDIGVGQIAQKCSVTIDGVAYDAYVFTSLTASDDQIRFPAP